MIELNLKEKVTLLSVHFNIDELDILNHAGVPKGSRYYLFTKTNAKANKNRVEAINQLFDESVKNWNDLSYLKNKLKGDI